MDGFTLALYLVSAVGLAFVTWQAVAHVLGTADSVDEELLEDARG